MTSLFVTTVKDSRPQSVDMQLFFDATCPQKLHKIILVRAIRLISPGQSAKQHRNEAVTLLTERKCLYARVE